MTSEEIKQLNTHFANAAPDEVVRYFFKLYSDKLTFATSFGAEDQALMHIIAASKIPIQIFALDTGKLFPGTYKLLELTSRRYHQHIKVYLPDNNKVQQMIENKGENLFYESVENRKLCCYIRKVEPLKRALNDMQAWITGLRRGQSAERSKIELVEWDDDNALLKINPLCHWTEEQLWQFIRKHDIPFNPLHDKNYKSIGCAPCTRALKPGEDVRAGRWWWEQNNSKECGLHEK